VNHQYRISLLKGEHGIWVLVADLNLPGDIKSQVIFEQSGLRTLDEALQYAQAAIQGNEQRIS
jgi:hypothetical protein